MEPGAWGYNWATLSLGDLNTGDLVLQVGGLDARLRNFSLKNTVAKSKVVKTGWSNLRKFWQNLLRKLMAQK
jgi:hypothetical protein